MLEIVAGICSVLCFLYLPLHSFALWLASFFLKREESLLTFIKCLNVPYLLVHVIVLLTYATGEFSILSGWDLIQEQIESGRKFNGSQMLKASVLALIPVAVFIASIAYGYMSYQRFLKPRDALYDEEYGLKSLTSESTEATEVQAAIKIDPEPRISTREDWEEPSSQRNNREGSMGFARFMARTFAVGGTARYVAKGFFAALGSGILNTENMETEEGLNKELLELARYILGSRLREPTPEYFQMLQLYEEYTGPGLTGLTIAILSVEAGFMENSEENQDMFREVIVEELVKKGIGERML
ncbi:MAG: hypothetical protein CME58_07640 [Halieaceae bacterium]|nr:hypothetical protein [Halieaceae bacterium]